PQPLLPAVARRDVRMIEEAEGKARLRTLGMTVPEGRTAAGDMASAVAVEVGFPVVLKMMGPRLAHKSEAGAVALGLESAERVTQAVAEMRAAVSACDPAALTDRFLVEKMAAKPVAELILSVRSDPQFGLALTLGSGGVLAELIGDSVTLLLPVTAREVEAGLRGLKLAHLLDGYRGAKAVNVGRLAAQIADFAQAVGARAGELAEVEINPFFVHEEGGVAVDVLLHEWIAT
ncbi:MAG: acetate--CoA ligase family protein, partial [Rhodobacteraceae bacterium]|nr:acetate--CoA ligase family protein [Paracoccaceae bacterium]